MADIFEIISNSIGIKHSFITWFFVIAIGMIFSWILKQIATYLKDFSYMLFEWFYTAIIIKENYKVLNMRKHVTICPNGHLIVLQDFNLKIYKQDTTFKRFFDVGDGAKNCTLDTIETLSKVPTEKRFQSNGFWYKSDPKDAIISLTENPQTLQNNKRKSFDFCFKKSNSLFPNQIYLMYGYSVQNGQPLVNGYYDSGNAVKKDNIINTTFSVKYSMNELTYVIGLLDGIHFKQQGIKAYIKKSDDAKEKKDIKFTIKKDLFYYKIEFKIKSPPKGSLISIDIPIEKP